MFVKVFCGQLVRVRTLSYQKAEKHVGILTNAQEEFSTQISQGKECVESDWRNGGNYVDECTCGMKVFSIHPSSDLLVPERAVVSPGSGTWNALFSHQIFGMADLPEDWEIFVCMSYITSMVHQYKRFTSHKLLSINFICCIHVIQFLMIIPINKC